ncbi:MAG: TonB-dependent receptor [Acidobacteriota bacterium]
MKCKKEFRIVPLLISTFLLLYGYPVFAQSGSTTASATGTVRDQQGKTIKNAVINFKKISTNLEREAISDENGLFNISQLPPGTYDLTASATDFRPETLRLDLTLGTTTVIEVVLKVGEVGEVILVKNTDEGRTESSTNIVSLRIDELPINRRNFLDFSFTTPRVRQDPRSDLQGVALSSTLSFNGQGSRQNNITIDGLDNNESATGSVRSTFSQEAVQEFQVVSDNYSAEFGRALGGIVNIVTKGGSNEFHGNTFFLTRNDKTSTRDVFATFKPPYRQYQFGQILSGPIKKDRAFFFTSFERLSIKQNNIVTISDQTVASARRLGFPINNGPVGFPIDTTSVLARADLQVTPNDLLSLRYNFGGTYNGAFENFFGPNDQSSGGIQELDDNSFAVNNTYVNSSLRLVNETRFLYSHRDQLVRSPVSSAQISIQSTEGIAFFGQSAILPQPREEDIFQFINNVSLTRGRNQIKFGVDFTYNDASGRAAIADNGSAFFNDIDFSDFLPGSPFFTGLQMFDPLSRTSEQRNFLVVLSSLLPIAFPGFPAGVSLVDSPLPLFYSQGFASKKQISVPVKLFSAFFEDGLKLRPNLFVKLGLRYDINRVRFVPDNNGNISPRIAVSYNPEKLRNLTINAAYGIFFSTPFFGPAIATQPPDRKVLNIPFPFSILPFQLPGNRFPESEQLPANVDFTPQLAQEFQFQSDLRGSYSHQARLAFDYALDQNNVITVSYNFLRGVKLFGPRQINPVVRPVPGDLTTSLITGRVDPTRGDIFEFESAFDSYYHALTLSFNRRFTNRFSLLTSYTFSKSISNLNENILPDQQEIMDTLNLGNERGLSLQDVRNRFVLSGIWDLSYTNNILLRDFRLSSIVLLESGRPYNLLSSVDLNNDGDNLNDRPGGLGRNTGITPGFANVDLRLTRLVTIKDRFKLQGIVEVFNLFNRTNIKFGNRIFSPDANGNIILPPMKGGRYILPERGFLVAFPSRQLQLGMRLTF